MTIRCRFVLLVLSLTLACGGDEDSLGVGNVSPTGSLGGVVMNAATWTPMEAVMVTVIAGGTKYPTGEGNVATDASGYYSVQDVPTGNFLLQFTPKDPSAFYGVTITATMPNAAGDFPLGNAILSIPPVGLVPLNGKNNPFVIQLVTPDGAPAPANIDVHLKTAVDHLSYGVPGPTATGQLVARATTDNNGRVSFVGIPDYHALAGQLSAGADTVHVKIPPFDSNKDGILDFMGKEVTFRVNSLGSTIPTIVLKSDLSPDALTVEAASIGELAGIHGGNRMLSSVSGPVYVTFNLPIRQDLLQISLYDEKGNSVVSTPTPSVSGNVLTINLPGLKAGAEYNMNLRAFAEVDSTPFEAYVGAPMFTPSPAAVTATLARVAKDPSRVNVTFNVPVGGFDPSLPVYDNIVYFDYDLDGGGTKGDAIGERGYPSAGLPLRLEETNPTGPAGKSGFGTTWYIMLPSDPTTGNPLPAGVALDLHFSHTNSNGYNMQRPDGAAVPDIKNLVLP